MEPEITEREYVEQLLEDFDLSRNDKIGELLEALEDEEAESSEADDEDEDYDAA